MKIDKIEVIPAPDKEMVDLTVQDDHTFWVSETGSDWYLTHNTSWPDIDSDCGDRDALINAARRLYGDDAVVPVSNFNTMKLKSLLLDVSKYFGVSHTEVFEVTRNLQEEVMPHAKDENTEKSVFVLKHDDCMEYSEKYRNFMEKYPDVKQRIELLFMQNKSIGRHAGGVIIAKPEELAQSMPIIQVKGELQTPWTEGMNWRNLEDNGFIKFDFLGLTLMEDVRNCIRRILVRKGNPQPGFSDVKKFFDENLNCRYVEPNDQNVFKTAYCSGRWAPGIFQFTACLNGDTLIRLADGREVPITQVEVGEEVLAYNEHSGEFEPRQVTATIDSGVRECIELCFSDGRTITCTEDHLFLTRNRGWIGAADLDEDDELVAPEENLSADDV